jgi:hypothetical protein
MNPTTFRDIEMAKGIAPRSEESSSSLTDWYDRIRNVPLLAFGIEDLCRSLRQVLYPQYVVPVALEALERDPLAGEMYEGELALAFRSLPDGFWREHKQVGTRWLASIAGAMQRFSGDVKRDLAEVVARIEVATARL